MLEWASFAEVSKVLSLDYVVWKLSKIKKNIFYIFRNEKKFHKTVTNQKEKKTKHLELFSTLKIIYSMHSNISQVWDYCATGTM